MNPCSARIAGAGRAASFGGGGSWSRGTRGEDRVVPCAGRALLLLVAADEARVLTVWRSGRCTTETADSDDLSAAVDVVGTFSPVLAALAEDLCSTDWLSDATALEDPAS